MALFKYNKEKLDYEKTNKLLKYRLIVAGLLILFGLTLASAIKKPTKEYIQTEITILSQNNQETVFELIDKYPFQYKDIIKAQAIIESGHFKSPVFRENNNVFGMRLAKGRITTATGDNLKHATYDSVEDAVIDRLLYEIKYLNRLNRKEYLAFLDRIYAEAGGYDKALEDIIKKNKL